ncbi:MAG TPA: sensor histidine kinase [Acidimicrobiales bacterium]|nr:sensor histidine kinase [Acidimicrobiales bacterium]
MATTDHTGSSRTAAAFGPGGWSALGPGLQRLLFDILPALLVGFIQLGGMRGAGESQDVDWSMSGFAAVLLLAGPVALLVRRRRPDVSLMVAFGAALLFAVTETDAPDGPGGFPALAVAVVTAIVFGHRTLGWGLIAVGYVAFGWLPPLVSDNPAPGLGEALGTGAGHLLMGSAGEVIRNRRERRAELAHTRAEEARRRASEARLGIARELHDVLAHNISLINVQAGVALHLLDERPEQARPALSAIRDASKEALGELRSVLDVLRRGAEAGEDADDAAPRAPTAGLRHLDGLIERTRAIGLDVRLSVEGEARPVPAGADLAAFRIVQEALTNVVRHADAHRATVRLAYGDDELTVQVDDDGRVAAGESSAALDGTGKGIAGMRERVQALGGSFSAGPRPGRGFRVRAHLPIDRAGSRETIERTTP